MLLLKLPPELQLSITKNLESERDISSFSQTSRHLHNLLSGYLYENNVKQHGSSALIWAAMFGCETVIQKFLDKNANINTQTRYYLQGEYYKNALQAASTERYDKVVWMLLDKNADINIQGGTYSNALQAASSRGYEKIMRMLLDKNANVNTQEEKYSKMEIVQRVCE